MDYNANHLVKRGWTQSVRKGHIYGNHSRSAKASSTDNITIIK